MDDDLEDELFYQTIMSHGRIISRFIFGIPFHSGLSNVARYAKFYLSKPECILLLVVTIVMLALVNNIDSFLRSAVDKLHYVGATYSYYSNLSFKNHRPANAGVDVFDGRSSTVFRKDPTTINEEIGAAVTWKVKEENYAVYSVKGRRPHMEDRFHVYHHKRFSLYGIFDGHGGEAAAQFVKEHLLNNIGEKIAKTFEEGNENSANYSQMLTEEILAVDQQLLNELKNKKDIGGTTAVVALLTESDLFVANVGDSRGVMCDELDVTRPLTFDHKPQQPKERNRIQSAGGFVSFNGVWRVAGILATSRALGDFPLKERNFITAEPDILTFKLSKVKPKFLILATDGLWDTFKNEEAVALVNKVEKEDSHYGAHSLVMQSYNRGSLDNISVMIVKI